MIERNIGERIVTKKFLSELYEWAEKECKKEDGKIGVLLCEGEANSVDPALYSAVSGSGKPYPSKRGRILASSWYCAHRNKP